MKKGFGLIPLIARLIRDQKGQIVILFTIMVPVMLGVIGLSLEVGRYWLLNSQLQNLADGSSLAGAKELDGKADALTRARDAARNYLNNDPWWSSVALGGVQITDPPIFYQKLRCVPDCTNSPNDITTTDPKYATFIKVTTVDRQITAAFLLAVGAVPTQATNATATAGSAVIACNTQSLMLCNPNEPDPFTATAGQAYHFKPKGGNSYAPGDFGLVDPPGFSAVGANAIRDLLSQQAPPFCYTNLVSPRPGQAVQKVADGINIRFDQFPGGGGNNNMDLTVAPSVVDGLIPAADCNSFNLDPPYIQMPDDPVMVTPASTTGAIIGTGITTGPGQTALLAYWNNHYSTSPPGGTLTRYDVYKREADPATRPTPIAGSEPIAPTCYSSNGGTLGNADRRVMNVAVMDCNYWNVQGNSVNYVPVFKYARFFIYKTSPISDITAGDIYGEYIDSIDASSGNQNLHLVVQLYRDQ